MTTFRKTALCISFLGLSISAHADFSSLDTSFGVGGLVTVLAPAQAGSTSASPPLNIQAVTEGSDKNLYLTGNASSGGAYIVRLTGNGTIDTSFGIQGYLNFPASTAGAFAVDSANQRIYLNGAGQASTFDPSTGVTTQVDNEFLTVYAYDFSGNPVNAFGVNGAAPLPNALTSSGFISGLQVLATGNILAVGNISSSPASLFAAEFTSAGALVSTFGTSGLATAAIPQTTSGISGALTSYQGGVDAGGNVYVVGGSAGTAGLIVRFTAAGQVDPTFGSNGVLAQSLSPTGAYAEFELIELNADGSSTALGYYQTASGQSTINTQALYTFSSTGQVVQSSTGETYNAPFSPNYALQSDGKFVFVGGQQQSATPSANVVRVLGTSVVAGGSTSGGTTGGNSTGGTTGGTTTGGVVAGGTTGSSGSGSSGGGAFSPWTLLLGLGLAVRKKMLKA